MTPAEAHPALRIQSCTLRQAGGLALLHGRLFENAWDAASFGELLSSPTTLAFTAGPAGLGTSRGTEGARLPWGLILGRVAADEAEILTLGVAAERRRQGIGRRLVGKLCRVAGRRGARCLYLEVAEGNVAARSLYARLGFRESGRRRGYYAHAAGPAEDAINLVLTLKALQ